METVRLSAERVNGFRLAEQGLSPVRDDVEEAVRAAGWLPARESAYLCLRARVTGFTRSMLDELVFDRKAVAEVGSVRGESFLVPREMVPAALRSPSPSLREAAVEVLHRAGVPESGRPALVDAVLEALENAPRPLPDLLERVTEGESAAARFLGLPGVLPAVLTLLRLEGRVARTRLAPPLDDGPPVYGRVEEAFPDLDVAGIAPKDALRILCAWYFRVHGPATRADFGWWAGAGPAEIAEAFEAHRASLVAVDIQGVPSTFWIPRSRLEELRAHDRPGADPLLLTPFLDPWLMSHEGRTGRFVRPEDLGRVVPGPAVPAVLFGGVAVGRWSYDLTAGEVRLTWFRGPPEGLGERAERIAAETSAWMRTEMPRLAPLSLPAPEGPIPVYL